MPFWARTSGSGMLAVTVIFLCSWPSPGLTGGESRHGDPIVIKPSPGQSPSPHRDQVRLRITVKNGRIVSITPISGPPALGAAAARWVKQKWEFAPDQTGTFTLPIVFQRAK